MSIIDAPQATIKPSMTKSQYDVPTYIQFKNTHISKIIGHDHGPLHGFSLFLIKKICMLAQVVATWNLYIAWKLFFMLFQNRHHFMWFPINF